MGTKGLLMKAFISTDNNIYDINEQFLEAGKYYFIIQEFTKNNSVIGEILTSNNNTYYEFRFFSLMTMMVKGQSYLARRLDKSLLSETLQTEGIENMPNYPSPKKHNIERITFLKEKNEKTQCMICLDSSDDYEFSLKKLKCGHKFHISCFEIWKHENESCPICRST
jgi:hypothetical protein